MSIVTPQRWRLAGIGMLSITATVASAGLTGWALHFQKSGMRAPELLGWSGLFILCGLVALAAALPALLIILVRGTAWCATPGWQCLLSTLLAGVFGLVAIIACLSQINPTPYPWFDIIIAGAICLAITGVVELGFGKRNPAIANHVLDDNLLDILQGQGQHSELLWSRTVGTHDHEEEIIRQGLERFQAAIPTPTTCHLYGWIDQAVLETKQSGTMTEIAWAFAAYRPAQNGDRGIIALHDHAATVLTLSGENGLMALLQYRLPSQTGKNEK